MVSGSGIYRNVWLIRRPAVHLMTDGIYVATQRQIDEWTLHIDTELQNDCSTDETVTLRHMIHAPSGDEICCRTETVALKTGLQIHKQTIAFQNPLLWDIKEPNQYCIKTELLSADTVIDTDTNRFGFRTIRFDSHKGFF